MTDVELARQYAECGLTGRCSEWPQLRPLLARLAARVEVLEGVIRAYAQDDCECPDCDAFRAIL